MLVIDKISRTPIYEQIVEGIQREILLGLLKPSQQLPSIRELAVTLSANPNTVQKAFIELDRRGIIISSPGRGCFVADDAPELLRIRLKSKISDIKTIASELATFGVSEDEIISAIKEAYSEKDC
ncbi:MAG: GntR family transcriptional regulator [Ruminococcaceae bacterium]|nr:GntR family transcriptional regulator [Oscillospiraceae bacterium]